ncbi:hypothetical protein, partial [uncultured Oscillibacter sp.]|uniref:hypothetical protein n=1 Tax=uncultured Oscillibacter sp. TaxID=876091 RepID=UPI0026100C1E
PVAAEHSCNLKFHRRKGRPAETAGLPGFYCGRKGRAFAALFSGKLCKNGPERGYGKIFLIYSRFLHF